MTTFGGDGKPSALSGAVSEKPMTEGNHDIEDVESAEDYKAKFGTCGSDGCPEGADDEDGILAEIEAEFEELDPLPTPEEADLGELCRVPESERGEAPTTGEPCHFHQQADGTFGENCDECHSDDEGSEI